MTAINKVPLIIGHRGAAAVAPENTLASFARALRDGADGIELDVRLAGDGVPVVIHDATLSPPRLRNRRVANTSSDKLKQIDSGSWFNNRHPRLARLEYSRQTIPTLEDVFAFLANQPNKDSRVYVELKTVRSKKRNAQLARAVVDVVHRHELQPRVVLMSSNLHSVAAIKQLTPSVRTGALFGPRQRAVKSVRQMIDATVARWVRRNPAASSNRDEKDYRRP
ncbi:MAG: glycerophosphodiester phosphodiesterase [Pyrinomonadaceae bacterium]